MLVLTLYPNNITLDNSAASYLEDVRWVMIGLDKDNLRLGIRLVTRREIDLHLVSMDQLHKVSVGRGYTKIGSKMIIEEISGMINQLIDGLRINATCDEMRGMLIADPHEPAADKGWMDYGTDLDCHQRRRGSS